MKSKKILFSTIIIIISVMIILYSLYILHQRQYSYLQLSAKNRQLSSEVTASNEKLKIEKENFSDKKNLLNSINEELSKLNIVNNVKNVDDLIKSLENNFNISESGHFNFSRNLNLKSNTYKLLDGMFFDSDINLKDIKENDIFIPFIMNNFLYNDLNKSINKNNSEIFENIGKLKYLKNGNNFLIKSKILSLNSNIEELKMINLKNNLSKLANAYFYETIDKNYSFEKENFIKKVNFDEIKDNFTQATDIDKLNKLEAFILETISLGINYDDNLSIVINSDEEQILNNTDQMISVKNDNDKKIISYYDKYRKKILTTKDLIE